MNANRTLVVAAHVVATAVWAAFGIAFLGFLLMVTGAQGWTGLAEAFTGVLGLLAFVQVLAIGGVVAGLLVAVPLAVAWFRGGRRGAAELVALAHVTAAVAAAGFVVLRFL